MLPNSDFPLGFSKGVILFLSALCLIFLSPVGLRASESPFKDVRVSDLSLLLLELNTGGSTKDLLRDRPEIRASGVFDAPNETPKVLSPGILYFYPFSHQGVEGVRGFSVEDEKIILKMVEAVSTKIDSNAVSALLQASVKKFGEPAFFKVVRTLALSKEGDDKVAAFWRGGGNIYAIAWSVENDKAGWISLKAVKEGAIPEVGLFAESENLAKDVYAAKLLEGREEFKRLVER